MMISGLLKKSDGKSIFEDEGLRPKDIDDNGDFNVEALRKIYTEYEDYLQKENLVDFAEFILKSYELIKDNEDLRNLYRKKFTHILVDEFQDTNSIQFKWINNLTGENTSVVAVGDDDQSIYGWRGAKVENINEFSKGKKHRNSKTRAKLQINRKYFKCCKCSNWEKLAETWQEALDGWGEKRSN